ncbi:MAG: SPOR domain-containing protein [Bacteroidota bacterium]
MGEFTNKLNKHLAGGKLEKAIEDLIDMLSLASRDDADIKQEVTDLRSQVILQSARYTELEEQVRAGIISQTDFELSNTKIYASFIDLVGEIARDYPLFNQFVNHQEEENAWEKASKLNTIGAYQEYFQKYPNGKYKVETTRIIKELTAIQDKKNEEIKRKATEEKFRRTQTQPIQTQNQSNRAYIIGGVGVLAAILIGLFTLGPLGKKKSNDNSAQTEFAKIQEFTGPTPAYVINLDAVNSEVQAKKAVKKLMDEGYRAGYLWPPKFGSISNNQIWVVFIGPYNSPRECGIAVDSYRESHSEKVYGVLVAHENRRVEIRGSKPSQVKVIENYQP